MSVRIALVQRHAGERTQEVGLRLAAAQLPFTDVAAVHAGAFPQTLRRALETAVGFGADWTIMLDADVLVLPGALPRLVQLAMEYPQHHACVNACCFDRLTSTARSVGLRCYRTSLIPLALEQAGWEGQVRPETALLELLGRAGHPTSMTSLLCGVHDVEQYYRDLYRTAVVHGVKFRDRGAGRNIARWCTQDDHESRVLVAGAREGMALGRVALDAERFRSGAETALAGLGLVERSPLAADAEVDVLGHLDRHLDWLRTSSTFTRNWPALARKLSRKPDQPRRLRFLRLLLQHRRLVLRRAPVRPLVRLPWQRRPV